MFVGDNTFIDLDSGTKRKTSKLLPRFRVAALVCSNRYCEEWLLKLSMSVDRHLHRPGNGVDVD